ncbi:MAG: UvrD-helicase domain-containing protein, partial [Armatimonadetes bacterium]|nr:UvrD-helicase domain-containing protein [Armatimonadota bacterium]
MVLPFDVSTLNPEQRLAVEWPDGPVMILAGAGSGKTRVITCRIARLMAEGVPPYRILSVTFTNKAAREMRERIEGMVGKEDAKMLWMGTFHSVCARILRMDGKLIGIDPNFVIYDDSDQLGIVRELIKQKNLDEKSIQPRGVLSEISRAKEKMLTPEEYTKEATGFFERLVADIYPEYQARLKRASAMDFDDILFYTVRLLEQRAEALEKYQNRFLHVMIDEYQDVNFSQYRLAQLLSGKHQNLTIVGDDDQSIYGWRGADVSLMMRFGSDYPNAKVVTLEQNYRSTKKILDAAYNVIKHNRTRTEKRLWTENNEGTLIRVREAGTEQDEAMTIADAIISDQRLGRRKFGEFAVLYRTNAQSRVMEEAFLTMRIPHVLVGGTRFYDRKEVKDMIAYLRVVLNPSDNAAIKRVINVPARGIGATSLEKFENWAAKNDSSLFEALKDQAIQTNLQTKARTAVKKFLVMIEDAVAIMERGSVTYTLKHILQQSGYQDELKAERTDESISRLENLQELINVTTQYDQAADEATLSGFLESVALIADVDSLNESGDAVT